MLRRCIQLSLISECLKAALRPQSDQESEEPPPPSHPIKMIERQRGMQGLDAREDIYSAGAVLYLIERAVDAAI